MGTIAEKLQKLVNTKEAIRQAIIGKGQNVATSDTFASYPAKIGAIQTGTDTSDATVTAADLRSGKVAYGKDGKVTGTVPDVEMATPTISVSSSGLISASVFQDAGFIEGGTVGSQKQLTTKSATTYTPSTSSYTIPAQTYLTGQFTVQGSSNLLPANIKKGVSIFGKTGTYEGAGAIREIVDTGGYVVRITSNRVYIYLDLDYTIGELLGISLLLSGSIVVAGPMADLGDPSYLYVQCMSSVDGWRFDVDFETGVTVSQKRVSITLKPGSTLISSFSSKILAGSVCYIPA